MPCAKPRKIITMVGQSWRMPERTVPVNTPETAPHSRQR